MLRLKGVALMGIVGACRGLWGGQGLGDRQEWEVSTTENAFSSGSRIEFEWVAKAKNSTQLGMLFVFFGAAKWEWTKALWVCIHECKARLSACATLP